ncbi:MAG: alginate lyase family protein [Deferrisomatales bacterium]|nr:alginate lyase family protein [Deferrisomatales bacterium]
MAGRINPANLPESRRLWALVDPGYRPIDWQLDWKSGFRWSEKVWYQDVRYGDQPGADIKVPWELGRMQHLPRLALAHTAASANSPGFSSAAVYAREFRNEVLDFAATNPPRYGANWVLAMDVGIRVTNWLIAWDLFAAQGARFDPEFDGVFARSVYEHARHVASNLEWNPHLVGNHYLANVAGLLFAAAYLDRTPETDAWLAFAVQELERETAHQFHRDGTNFEASVPYHRLSGEMLAYTTALVLGLPPQKREALLRYDRRRFRPRPGLRPAPLPSYELPGVPAPTFLPRSHFELLEKAAEFVVEATRPDGRIAQFGDNDSGRFLALDHCVSPSEDGDLDARGLVAAVNGLFGREDFGSYVGAGRVESLVAAALTGNVRPASYRSAHQAITAERVRIRKGKREELPEGGPSPVKAARELQLFGYPDFGLFVYRSPRVYLAVRCGPVGQDGNGGHAHNDQLSFEVCVNGEAVVADPGTYLYTPAPDQRNCFRSTAMHSTLAVPGREQNGWERGRKGLFRMPERARARVLEFSEKRFVGEHGGFGAPHRRTLSVRGDGVEGTDECSMAREGTDLWFHLVPGARVERVKGDGVWVAVGRARVAFRSSDGLWRVEESSYSSGYGHLAPAKALALAADSGIVHWVIEMVDDGR